MKRSRFTDELIIGFLEQVELRAAVKLRGREHRVSDASFYMWRSRFGGMDVADARRMRELKVPLTPNEVWSMNFVSDSLEHGRRLEFLTKRSIFLSATASRAST
jgi:putative transposase